MPKQSKQNFNEYQALMKNKFDLEDRMARRFNEKWKLNKENIKCGQQLGLVEDQIRSIFKRFRVERKSDKEESNL